MSKTTKEKLQEIKEAAESDLAFFIKLVAPHRLLGSIHEELIQWWTREGASTHQLVLLPRGHQKSMLMAYRVAWEITKNPAVTILYISSTSELAELQLKAIQDILTSRIYRMYWPEMVHEQEGLREKWTSGRIAVDHPTRKLEGVRDPTVFTGGLNTSLTGFHCDIAVLDDTVVQENAYTAEGRTKVQTQYSLLSSIENAGACEWVVGTRYDPRDLYSNLMEMHKEVYDDLGNIVDREPVYEIFERKVEDAGDGTGEFIWPRTKRTDGKWFGFNTEVLATKRAQYLDKMQFRAQYYNDPNDPDSSRIDRSKFQYYDQKFIKQDNGYWWFKSEKLNVFAAIDFAFSIAKRADYTAIVVIGVDKHNNFYVLDIERFKSEGKVSTYFKHIFDLFKKWGFRKMRAEVTVAQEAIVNSLKEEIKTHGMALSIDSFRPSRHQGSKEERLAAILEPRYENQAIWHYRGGNCSLLEEELTLARPPHDDIMDAMAAAIDVAVPPTGNMGWSKKKKGNVIYHERFGGVSL